MMPHAPTPWIGLAAVVAMFVLPFLPAWLFEGPRTVKRYPRRVLCGDCGASWTDDHLCELEEEPPRRRLQGELVRTRPPARPRALTRSSGRSLQVRRF
jgi:hypothetical protein